MFSQEEKVEIANEIISRYFSQNFGQTSKADFELLLFSHYLDHLITKKEPYDDYSISRALGITQSRVRSLKERKELIYPYVHDKWKMIFASEMEDAKYDEQDHHIKFIVEDINVRHEARHYIEEKGWYDEFSLNSKLINLPLKAVTEIFLGPSEISIYLTPELAERLKKSESTDSAVKSFLEEFTKDGLNRFLMSATKESLMLILDSIPFGGVAGAAFKALFNVISRA